MKKIKLILLIFIMLLPFNIKASCSNTELSRYGKIASNINYSYTYSDNGQSASFDITFNNLSSELTIYDTNRQTEYRYLNGQIEATYTGYPSGRTLKFLVYAGCNDLSIRTIYIELPYYNLYYKDPLCTNHSDDNYCKRWFNTSNLTRAKFNIHMYEYEDENKTENEENNEEKDDEFDYGQLLIEYYLKYYYYILPTFILFLILYRKLVDRERFK